VRSWEPVAVLWRFRLSHNATKNRVTIETNLLWFGMHQRRHFSISAIVLLASAAIGILPSIAQDSPAPFSKWDEKIREFEEQDKKSSPAPGQALFVGSSSIVGWNLAKSFPGMATLNRGFGGSEVADSLYFADRIILAYKPEKIFLYAGDNDIGNGKSAQKVFDDFVKLAQLIEEKLPETQLIFVAIKPSIKRWNLWPEMQRANDMVAGYARAKSNVHMADIAPATLGKNGEPDPGLFKEDGLHLNPAGYAAWNKVILPFLTQ
jgi:lysophospholipase L1-like esterase